MITSSLVTSDGVRIVYDQVGNGPALVLLHGGGGDQSRKNWAEVGYVDRLRNEYQVIAIDIRGHGESDKPTDPASYTIERICQDILDVADACGVEMFSIWGFSYGGNIGRYLAAQSERVTKIIIMGIPFGAAATGDFLAFIKEFQTHWTPIVHTWLEGSMDEAMFSEEDQEIWAEMDVPVTLGWLTAMLGWGENHPGDLFCPVLWLSGSENEATMTSIRDYEGSLIESRVQVHIVNGLNHIQEFEEFDAVLPAMLAFTKG